VKEANWNGMNWILVRIVLLSSSSVLERENMENQKTDGERVPRQSKCGRGMCLSQSCQTMDVAISSAVDVPLDDSARTTPAINFNKTINVHV
jgi:hypothetical protein